MAQMVKNLLAMQETRVHSLGQEDPLEEENATHSSTLAWRIPWTEEPDGLQSLELQRVGQDWMTHTSHFQLQGTPNTYCCELPHNMVWKQKTVPQKPKNSTDMAHWEWIWKRSRMKLWGPREEGSFNRGYRWPHNWASPRPHCWLCVGSSQSTEEHGWGGWVHSSFLWIPNGMGLNNN